MKHNTAICVFTAVFASYGCLVTARAELPAKPSVSLSSCRSEGSLLVASGNVKNGPSVVVFRFDGKGADQKGRWRQWVIADSDSTQTSSPIYIETERLVGRLSHVMTCDAVTSPANSVVSLTGAACHITPHVVDNGPTSSLSEIAIQDENVTMLFILSINKLGAYGTMRFAKDVFFVKVSGNLTKTVRVNGYEPMVLPLTISFVRAQGSRRITYGFAGGGDQPQGGLCL